MHTLNIQLLGNFQLHYAGHPVTGLQQARLQSLLAYLLLQRPVAQPRQHLAFLFWPDSSEAQALTNLRKQLLFLRRVLPDADQFLRVDTKVVEWNPNAVFTLDVTEFEQALARARALSGEEAIATLQAAITLYTGDLLPGCYEDWIVAKRAALREKYSEALERCLLLLEDRRDYPAAIQIGQQLLRHDPLHEATYRRLMRLHARNGERAAALNVYHTCVTILQRELSVEPNAETRAAYQRLLQQEIPEVLRHQPSALVMAKAPFVGRQAEWAKLTELWRMVARGHAHFVLLTGEAGIGKTRLAEELLAWAEQQGVITAHAHTYAAEGRLAYAPVIEWLRAAPLKSKLTQLNANWLTEVARLLPELLTERPALPAPNAITASWQRHQLFEALARATLAGKQPLLLLLDDLQWCDQETLAWLHFLLRYAAQTPLLVIGTARTAETDSDALAAWLADLQRSARFTTIELAPLTEQETAALVGQMADGPMAPSVAKQLYQETEGNPLFVVEMMRTKMGDEGLAINDASGTPNLQSPVSNPRLLPPKVHAVLQARLAQLSPPARELARVAATIGRAFTVTILSQASASDEDALVRALDELWQQRIVREQDQETYDFCHDKLREVAYGELSPVRRRLLHRRVAGALEQMHDAVSNSVSGQIAAHYEQAGLAAQAIRYYRQTAAADRRIYANHEASQQLEKALRLLGTLPSTPEYIQQELHLQMELAAILMDTTGYASAAAEQAYARALALSAQVEKSAQLFPILWGLHEVYLFQAKYEQTRALSEQCLALAEELQDPDLLLQAHHALWAVLAHLAPDELPLALTHAQAGIARYDPAQHHVHAFHYGGHDPGLCCREIAARVLWLLGYPAQARQVGQEALQLGYQLNHPLSLVFILINMASMHVLYREADRVAELTAAAITIALERKIPHELAEALLLHGWALAMQGQVEQGIAQLQQGIAEWDALGLVLQRSYHLLLLAEAYTKAGQLAAALTAVEEALTAAYTSGERYLEAEAHRLRGQLLLATGPAVDAAEHAYQQALAVARQQKAKSLELRATVSLSRLWQQQGKQAQARQLLAEIYGWFTEGFDTIDLIAAKTLLAELA
ncbi:MAG: 6-hydroxy-D-nicotine oxidase [Caldilinea sp. CFX5]|nr:6-hydroxy-D-nicotine oxidase [Caldilinea sp. CFX5]